MSVKKYNLDAYNRFRRRGVKAGYPAKQISTRWKKYKTGRYTIADLLKPKGKPKAKSKTKTKTKTSRGRKPHHRGNRDWYWAHSFTGKGHRLYPEKFGPKAGVFVRDVDMDGDTNVAYFEGRRVGTGTWDEMMVLLEKKAAKKKPPKRPWLGYAGDDPKVAARAEKRQHALRKKHPKKKTKTKTKAKSKDMTADLVYKKGTSDKFYTLTLSGNQIKAHWGRTGSAGQRKMWTRSKPGAAEAFWEKKVEEKLAKGYKWGL